MAGGQYARALRANHCVGHGSLDHFPNLHQFGRGFGVISHHGHHFAVRELRWLVVYFLLYHDGHRLVRGQSSCDGVV